jgi:hypothetical protein
MVRANGANTNTENHAPLSSDPQARRLTFNAPSLLREAGGGMRCALASLGQRRARGPRRGAGRLGRRALRARLLRAFSDGAATLAHV